jgi:PhnB protein
MAPRPEHTPMAMPYLKFYGERAATLRDPFGHVWYFSTVTETLTAEEMMRRMPK